ncbi:transposase [Pochonia chlamydosporia 170]|uniref:Transposase n=1 Tax=Pochonia chlamydosporia 170 TaxID=1380566 RepID=A0A219AR65_METCM|nr:transposase [Pochonia chlamydosporia 170]XP_022285801.1 transposase [Pochonia chlamydosporia 170]XP_022285953.1 transposase [Pochonia chlamydosporia 170]OWT42804.1 transposase [Pochonia chlamydosporia 170]OWT43371.1 transposase [Pochonia chlamydosporia 170]OWT43538.1 transposase [Pochonia chlamydosporia 170]
MLIRSVLNTIALQAVDKTLLMLAMAHPPGFPEPSETLPVDSADESISDSDECNEIDESEDWNGEPWEAVFPSDSSLLTTTYESLELLLDSLKEFCVQNRMGLITIRSQKNKAKTRTIKCELVCDKSRYYKPRESIAKIRNTNTTKLAANCPFKVIVQSLHANNYEWSMRVVSSLHRDHGPSQGLTEHYQWRKLTDEQMNLLKDLCLDKTISSRSVHKQLCQKWPQIAIRRTDIYNWRWKVNQAKRQGYGPANDFVRTLSESKRVWIWGLDWIHDEFRFRNAAWAYHKGGKMWQQFSSCLQIDATYKTNCYKMPLVTVVTVSSEKTSMPICYGLLNNEQVATYEWFLQQLSRFQQAGNIAPPKVIITDKDDQLRAAARQIFPNAQLQLCVFHINSNVVLSIKKWWKKTDGSETDSDSDNADTADIQEMERGNVNVKDMKDSKLGPVPKRVLKTRAGLYLLWRHMVFSRSEDEFNQAWRQLQETFEHQERILSYLKSTYLPLKKEWACCYTRHYRNFGLITTAPAESNHHSLKTYNLSLRSDLPDVEEATASQTVDKRLLYKDKIQQANTTIRNQFSGREWLGQLPLSVTRWALDQLNEIHRLMESGQISKKPLLACTGSTKAQYGLPCAHMLLRLADQDKPLKREDLDPFWHIKRSREIDDPLLQVQRPPMGIPKGRPQNGEPFGNERAIPDHQLAPQGSTRSGVKRSARRNYSQFELGSTLDEEDAADLPDQQQPRRKRSKVSARVTTRDTRQQAKGHRGGNNPAKQHHSPDVEEDHKITKILLAKGQKKWKEKEKVGDSIVVATD